MAPRLPRRGRTHPWTDGYLIRGDGTIVTGGPIASGDKGPGKGWPGLDPTIRCGWPAAQHVEGHMAALMRANRRLRTMILVLNNPPCRPERYPGTSCEELLEKILPRGTTLDVYATAADGCDRTAATREPARELSNHAV